MRRPWPLHTWLACLFLWGCAAEPAPPLVELQPLVDPRIGTGGRGWWAGNAFVGASAPFGMVQLGPDGADAGGGALPWNHCAGFHAVDAVIRAFSHVHLHGTGIADLGNIGVMPVAGPMTAARIGPGAAAAFAPESLRARPGFFAVELPEEGLSVELAALPRAGHHRVSLLPGSTATRLTLVVDVGHVLPVGEALESAVELEPGTGRLQGWIRQQNGFSVLFGGLTVYFHARASRPPLAHGVWEDGQLFPGEGARQAASVGAYLEFDPADGPIELAVGISYTGMEGARANLEAEIGARTFDESAAAAEAAWVEPLSLVRVGGGSPAEQVIFATAVYHTLLMPNLFADADGSYLGLDGQVHPDPGFAYHTNFSLWDTYRCLHSWLLLVLPDRQLDLVRSLLAMAAEGGYLPRWPLGPGETNIMISTPADAVLAESHLKGLAGFDAREALAASLRLAEGAPAAGSGYAGREGIEDYLALGYVPADHVESVSNTLEHAVADASLSWLAAALGEEETAARLGTRARSYRNLYEPTSGYFRPRNADGSWVEPFDPLAPQFWNAAAYTEGDALQYLWLVPQDPADLMDLLGGPGAMASRLDAFFAEGAAETAEILGSTHDDLWWMTETPRYYWHGNEPDIHAAYLFLQAGRPDLTQRWVRWIGDTLYTTRADGLPGNDDAGTLSAWYVFSALGLYPLAGSDLYLIGAPRFPRAEVRLPGGLLEIVAPGASAARPYVRAVRRDGIPLERPWIRHAELAAGGRLEFEMAAEPADWGALAPGEALPLPPLP